MLKIFSAVIFVSSLAVASENKTTTNLMIAAAASAPSSIIAGQPTLTSMFLSKGLAVATTIGGALVSPAGLMLVGTVVATRHASKSWTPTERTENN